MKGLIILIAVVLVFVFICIAWSAISLERIDAKLEHWDQVLEQAEK